MRGSGRFRLGGRQGLKRSAPLWLVVLVLGAAACGGAAAKPSAGTGSPTPSPAGRFRGGGVAGTIVSSAGSSLLLNLRAGGTATVDTSPSTVVLKTVTATVGSIQPNMTVFIAGPVDASGGYDATSITISPGAFGAGAGAPGGNSGGGAFSPRPRPSGGPAGGRGGTVGTVSAISGPDLTLTTFSGAAVQVVTSPSTTVSEVETGALSDLTPGTAVSVTGPKNADGSYSATRITIGGAAGFFGARGAGPGVGAGA